MTRTVRFNVHQYLDTPESRAAYLNAAFEEGDIEFLLIALGDVAKATGMADIADSIGMGRTSLYKALSGERDPRISTVIAVLDQLGLKLEVSVT